mgnify:CR=1 FL=1
MNKDTFEFQTINSASDEVLYKDKGSKFFGYAFPIQNEIDVKRNIDLLKEKHKSAGHFCYAYRLGVNGNTHKLSDDGEPNNSAGMPILGQLRAKNITNALVVIVRYFGGTKLGVGGLISAYKTTSKQSLDTCKIRTLYIEEIILVHFSYNELSHVMRIVKKFSLKILEQHQELECWLKILVKKRDLKLVKSAFESHHKIKLDFF